MWPFNLSVRLPIVALVGLYPANQLMGRRLIPRRSRRSFPNPASAGPYHAVLSHVSMCYPKLEGRLSTCYSPVRRSRIPKDLTARLACLKRAASVRSEPGSNSPLSKLREQVPAISSLTSLSCHTRTNRLFFIFRSIYLNWQKPQASFSSLSFLSLIYLKNLLVISYALC